MRNYPTALRPTAARSTALPLLLLSLVLAAPGCQASQAPNRDLVRDDRADDSSQSPIGSFRPDSGDGEIGFSAIVLRADKTYYAEFCNGVPSSQECQRGHEALGEVPVGEAGSEWNGDVHISWGTYERLRSPSSGERFLKLSSDGDDDYWVFSYEEGALKLWRDQPELGAPGPDRISALSPAEPICWQDADCTAQGYPGENFYCIGEAAGPGQCAVVDDQFPMPVGTLRPESTAPFGFSAMVLRSDGTFYSEFCDENPSSQACQRGHEAFGPAPSNEFGSLLSGEVSMAWGHYRVLSNLLAKTSFLQFSTDIADDVWAMDYDGGALSLWRDQPDLGAPARVDKLRPATPICWQASDCQQQGIGGQEFVCTSEAQGPGQCLVME